MSKPAYIFLLVGKTGVGKSALGNSILGKYVFESTNSPEAVTNKTLKESTERDGIRITVVDTPGFMSTELKREECMVQACKDMKDAMRECSTDGQLVVTYVIKYGERFTNENKDALYIFENTFGKNLIWKSCIIVMTYGDLYDGDCGKKYFYDYLKQQTGDFGEMFKKCDYNCVLFSNKTKDIDDKSKQFKTLLNSVSNRDQSYNHIKFQQAIKEQNRIALEAILPSLREDFQKSIHQLNCNINEIKFNPESLGELEKVDFVVRDKLCRANEIDSPETIYYVDKETRLLEEIRISFFKMLHLIEIKKEDFRQMKLAHDFQIEIEEIREGLITTDPTNPEIFEYINITKQKIRDKSSMIKKYNLRTELVDNLNKSITSTIQELNNFEMRAQRAEEDEITKKRDDIDKRLKNVNTHDKEATEHLNNLKQETNTLKGRLENKHLLINKQTAKGIKSSLKIILHDIKDKEEMVKQFKTADSLNISIEQIKQDIINADPKNEGTDRFISDVDQTLQSLEKMVKKENLSKELKDHLKLSIIKAQNHLQTLKNQEQERKEMEIKTIFKSITERVQTTDCQDKEVLNILSQARNDTKSLMCKLAQVKKKISDNCFEWATHELNKIEKAIEMKEQTAQQWIRTDLLMIRINEVIKAIGQINPRDQNITETMFKLKAEVLQLQKEINESNVGEKFLQLLNEAVQNAEKMILDATILIEKVRKEKLESEIDKIKEQICQLDVAKDSCEQATNQIKAHLKELKYKIKQEELKEDVKEYLMLAVKSMKLDINVINEDATQRTIAINIMKEIQFITIRIDEIPLNKGNILAKRQIAKAELSDALKKDLFSALESAERILDKRKQDTIKTIESDLDIILEKITKANPNDLDITLSQYIIKEKLMLLKLRIGDHFKEKYEECEKSFELLVSRVDSFNEIKKEIDALISRIKNLGIPCIPSNLDGLGQDVEKIRKDIKLKIKYKNDEKELLERIERCCVEAIKKKKRNNWKISGGAIRYVPILGTIIGDAITAAIDNIEENQRIN